MSKVKIAVIGGGRVGVSHIHGIKNSRTEVELAGIVEMNRKLADELAEKHETKAFYSIEESLVDESIDAYLICLPHYLHYPVGKQILESKRHLLMEKPLGIKLNEIKELIEIAENNNVRLMAAHSRRFHKAVQQAREYLPVIKGPRNLLYTMAQYFDKETAPPWWRDEAKAGKLVLEMLGTHSIDLTLWMFEGRKPVKIYCEPRNINDNFEGDDAATVIIKFNDGTIATSYLSITNAPVHHSCLIEGTEGTIYFKHPQDYKGLVGATTTELYVNGERVETQDEPDCFTLQIDEFISAINENRDPSTSGKNVYASYVVLEAAKKSALTQLPVEISDDLVIDFISL